MVQNNELLSEAKFNAVKRNKDNEASMAANLAEQRTGIFNSKPCLIKILKTGVFAPDILIQALEKFSVDKQ